MSRTKFLLTLTRPERRRSIHKCSLNRASSPHIKDICNVWLENSQCIPMLWKSYVRQRSLYTLAQQPLLMPPTDPKHPRTYSSDCQDDDVIDDHLRVAAAIRSYQTRGHLMAKLDPLGITTESHVGTLPTHIIESYNLNSNLDRVFKLPSSTFIGGDETHLPLKEIIKRLEEVYCGSIGLEFMHIDELEERTFIRQRMEPPNATELPIEEKILLLKRLTRATDFEGYLAKKWSSAKRFGLEGCDTMIPVLKTIIDKASCLGVESVIIGMSHRGRLNVLANVCRMPLHGLYCQFEGLLPADLGSGDIKYHLGAYTTKLNRATQKNITMSLCANPSHLEVVSGVTIGKAKAEQFYAKDDCGKKTMAIVIHGDASFCGQGIVYETFHFSYLPGYTTHGVIHIIQNNQIGFTTDPRFGRSSRYCSDGGKVVNAPIFHVNCDDPEKAIHVANTAAEYRCTFHKDVVLDLVGYRRFGHSEVDEPMFTQPRMYTVIRKLEPTYDIYVKKLICEKVIDQKHADEIREEYLKISDEHFEKAKKEKHIRFKDWLDSPWSTFFDDKDPLCAPPTGVPDEDLVYIAKMISTPPPGDFVIHDGLKKILENRMKLVEQRLVDWPMGEALAYGTLLKEKIHVRLSGEDVERGGFSHRHHVIHDQTKDMVIYIPLMNLYPDQGPYSIHNSSLSEYGILAFEVGYSQTNPDALVVWEAQFGDFGNVAQCVIDQFISSGQQKWVRQSGLVVSLPHGLDGGGPEHSSGRPERFLQMCDDDPHELPELNADLAMRQLHACNWIITNVSTPANLFHLYRRQITLPFRKPVIQFSPKNLLKNPDCRSSFDEMGEGTEFLRIIPEEGEASQAPECVQKLILCSGKIFYMIKKARKAKNLDKEIALIRLEQLSPFPFDLIKQEVDKYPNAKLYWGQEEHKNSGSYMHVLERMRTLYKGEKEMGYIGRPVAAAPACGSTYLHKKEIEKLEEEMLAL